MQFTDEELRFIENYGLGESYMFDDPDEFDEADKNKELKKIAKEMKDFYPLILSIHAKVEHFLPKVNPEVVKILHGLIKNHSVQPPDHALEALALEITEKIDSWA